MSVVNICKTGGIVHIVWFLLTIPQSCRCVVPTPAIQPPLHKGAFHFAEKVRDVIGRSYPVQNFGLLAP